ncbi:WAP four-disulfide core domain protein 2-like [Eleutherodactylus coqui]|uniref:WAP four-disulfide core domain protein 2-like n=1 Tax=Eleutherodactylus coqui TaxID=57060 RepID=UPI0034631D41
MTCNKLFLVTFLVLWMEVSCLPNITERKIKRGLCPKPESLSNWANSSAKNCTCDDDCLENMKCCDTGRGLQCAYAERRGFCPCNDLPRTEPSSPKCKSDFDCYKNAKCCDRGSSKDCLPAAKKKPAKCHSVPAPLS